MPYTPDTSIKIPTTANVTSTANPLTANFTCGSGSTLLVVSLIYVGAVNRAGGAPTYNGIALQPVGTPRRGVTSPECTAEMWYLLRPPIGLARSVSIPNSGALAMKAYVSSAKSSRGASFLNATGGAGTTGTNPTGNVSTTSGDTITFAVVASGATTWLPTARTGVQIGDDDLGAWGGGAQYFIKPTAGAQAMSWTFPTSEDYGLVVGAFKEGLAPLPNPDTVKLTTKLNAILSKDVAKIIAEDVYLPFVGRGYTRATLENWLASRADILTQAQGATVAQIDQRTDTYYQSLITSDKIIADKILDGMAYDLSLASDFNAYEKLVAIVLSTFITRAQ
jgi:hypothetical protein